MNHAIIHHLSCARLRRTIRRFHKQMGREHRLEGGFAPDRGVSTKRQYGAVETS